MKRKGCDTNEWGKRGGDGDGWRRRERETPAGALTSTRSGNCRTHSKLERLRNKTVSLLFTMYTNNKIMTVSFTILQCNPYQLFLYSRVRQADRCAYINSFRQLLTY